MTEDIKKKIQLKINAKIIENKSNYALFNEGMRKGAEIAKDIILSEFLDLTCWRKIEEELPEVKDNDYQILLKDVTGKYNMYWVFANSTYSIADELDDYDYVEWKPID